MWCDNSLQRDNSKDISQWLVEAIIIIGGCVAHNVDIGDAIWDDENGVIIIILSWTLCSMIH